MAEKRKFAALAELHRIEPGPTESISTLSKPERSVLTSEVTGKGRGRPATGKRSNPDYKLYAHYLRKRTHREAMAKLGALYADDDQRPDMSDLVEELLQGWLARLSG